MRGVCEGLVTDVYFFTGGGSDCKGELAVGKESGGGFICGFICVWFVGEPGVHEVVWEELGVVESQEFGVKRFFFLWCCGHFISLFVRVDYFTSARWYCCCCCCCHDFL